MRDPHAPYDRPRRDATPLALAAALLFAAPAAAAQADAPGASGAPGAEPLLLAPAPPIEAPEPAPAVLRATELPYLTDAERADARVRFGLWTESDLDDPARRARAALTAGVYDDPALADPAAPADIRAEAMIRRGEHAAALDLLADRAGLRADRLRAEALAGAGRVADALAVLEPLARTARLDGSTSADELTSLAEALVLRARLAGEPAETFELIIGLLSEAHQRVDRLHWPALLAEAELLFDKSNAREGTDAARAALGRNAASARAWFLLGDWSVSTFDFDRAEAVAARLDRLERRLDADRDASADRSSVYGDLIRARARLRQDDPELALRLLDRALERYPDHPLANAMRCAALSMTYDFAAVEDCLSARDAAAPGDALALYWVGTTLSEDRQYDEAARYLARAHERLPRWPEPIVERGLLELQAGNDASALDALRAAAELDPFHTRARNSLTLVEELLTYDTAESEHFIVRYRPGVDAVLAREMLADLESMHGVVADFFDHEPERRTLIELMPDHEWFAVRITGVTRIHTMAAATGPVIAMETPRDGKRNTGEYDWLRVVRHEYAHTVTLSKTANRIPHWFTEAAAVTVEFAPRDYNTCRLLASALLGGELFDFDEINIAFVRPEKPSDRSQAYAQGRWMYEYMVERFGHHAPLELMDRYARGQREHEAFPGVLGVTTGEFLDDFSAWALGRVRSWGLAPTPSLDALRLADTLAEPAHRERLAEALAATARAAAAAIATGAPIPRERLPLVDPSPDRLERWLAEHPEHPAVLELLVRHRLDRSAGAATDDNIPLLERYAKARPVDPAPHRLLARHYLASDDPARAIEHLEFLDAREITSSAYAVELARRYADLGDWPRARAKIDRATRIAPFDPAHRELAATIALRQRDYRAAERHLLALAEIEPQREQHRRRLEALNRLRDGAAG